MSNETNHTSYVDRVREDTQKYVRRLLGENEQLRVTIAQLESEIGRVKQELTQRQVVEHELQLAVERIRAESEQYMAQFAEVEMHNANLANLYVASYQLHGTLERDTVLNSMQEIIVNLVGSEEFAICEIEDEALTLLASVGLEDRSVTMATPCVRDAVTSGVPHITSPIDRNPTEPLVCLPLKLDGRVIGVIVIISLLSHKMQLEPLDHELFDLLATHAATALYCTSLHERVAG
ncbi:MAG TPA: GAF domain-containing protein [Thermoanaerobaculia bacterium]